MKSHLRKIFGFQGWCSPFHWGCCFCQLAAGTKAANKTIYPSGMQEEELRRYFLGERSVSELAQDLHGSVIRVDDIGSTVRITDMQGSFSLTRLHLVMLCDAFLEQALTPEALNTVAFALMASDAFEWDDDITSEVLLDWLAPEINFELNYETIHMHRGWLLGSSEPPQRKSAEPLGATAAHLISVRTKISR